MKLKHSVQFYMQEIAFSCGIYYGVNMLVFLVGGVITIGYSGEADVNVNTSTDIGTPILVFVWGLLLCGSYIKFFLQNGVSRKTMFTGAACSIGLLSAAVALIDTLVRLLLQWIGNTQMSLYAALYRNGEMFGGDSFSTLPEVLTLWLWTTFLYLFVGFLGMLVGLAFYRLSKIGKIILGVGLGGSVMILLPLLEAAVTHGAIVRWFGRTLQFLFGISNPLSPNPYIWVASAVCLSAVLLLFCFLLFRRAAPQKA